MAIIKAETELRKLPALHTAELGRILDVSDVWKTFMSSIPSTLRKDCFQCGITCGNLPKYTFEHIMLIEQASKRMNRSCTEILFDEWGCSGRVRPTIGHLLHLLTKAELYRAADYVARNILNQDVPARPNYGPLARVDLNTMERKKLQDPSLQNIEEILDAIDYPSSAIEQIHNSINRRPPETWVAHGVPRIVVSETPSYDEDSNPFSYAIPTASQTLSNENNVVGETRSDMIKFSSDNVSHTSPNVPLISELLNGRVGSRSLPQLSTQDADNLPNLTELNISQNVGNFKNVQSNNMPHLSDLLGSNSNSFVMPSESITTSNVSQVLSNIAHSNQSYLPNFDAIQSSQHAHNSISVSAFLPATLPSGAVNSSSSESEISMLKDIRSQISKASGTNLSSNKQCSSPLPSLSLNTSLPHVTYCELEVATNYFDETPCRRSPLDEHDPAPGSGRFLGSGAFGSVFLALGILDRPIAVKRINLKDLNVVKADDFVTTQFKNEVEVLCRYKHDNLLSLLGYSCDGLTYCLLYEYMPGGNLMDRLELTPDELFWTLRLHIAMGTARGISYLHTAYSSPLVHRDIKSANILLDATNKPKLCDFGIIRISSTATTSTTRIFGTAAYMAPEAHRGNVSVKMDTFSFGVVLLELITGLPPIDDSRANRDLVTHVQDSLEDEGDIKVLLDSRAGSWTAKDINFGNELYVIASKCLQERRNLRPTMTDITKLLSELLQKS